MSIGICLQMNGLLRLLKGFQRVHIVSVLSIHADR